MTYAPAKFEAAMSNSLRGNALTRNICLTLIFGSRSHKHCPLHHVIYVTAKFEVATANGLWDALLRKIHYMTLTPMSRGSRSHKMLTSTLDFMWPMHQQSFMLLHPMVKEKMHLQENTLFELDLGDKVTQNVAQYPQHYVIYAQAKFDIDTSHGWWEEAFSRKYIKWHWPSGQGHTKCCQVPSTSCDLCTYRVWSYLVKSFRRRSIYKKIQYLTFDIDLGVKVTQNVAQYPLHHVTYSATKFKVATSNQLGGDAFTS